MLSSPPVSQTATLKQVSDTPMTVISTTGRSGNGIRARNATTTPTVAMMAATMLPVPTPNVTMELAIEIASVAIWSVFDANVSRCTHVCLRVTGAGYSLMHGRP